MTTLIRILGLIAALCSAAIFAAPAAAQATEVHITAPFAGTVLDITQPVAISGTATAVFEGTVVVQAQDANGAVLAQTVATAAGASLGSTGTWAVSLPVYAASGSGGSLYAYATSPRDGSIVAADRVYVQYGAAVCSPRADWVTYSVVRGDTLYSIARRAGSTVAELTQANCLANPRHILAGQALYVPRLPAPVDSTGPLIHIDRPAAGAALDLRQPVQVSGTARALFEGALVIQAQDANGAVLAEMAATAPGSATGGTGTWSVNLTIAAPGGTGGSIYAYATSARDGTIVAADRISVQYGIGACALRTDWPTYTVVRGDTLYSIARRYGSTVSEMTQANCLANPRHILVGQALYVPPR